jgi:hypothetical protein
MEALYEQFALEATRSNDSGTPDPICNRIVALFAERP